MHVGIIGGGLTGLSAAIYLAQHDHQVTLFEATPQLGGLAAGFKDPCWDWPLEKHYHHLFASDWSIRHLAEVIDCPVSYQHPLTSTWYAGSSYQLDSPTSLLKFSPLDFASRLRTGFGLSLLKILPWWQIFEATTAATFIKTVMGETSWKVLWEPLMTGKFGRHADTISATWFWARIYKRSSSLGYPEQGFTHLIDQLENKLTHLGVKIILGAPVTKIESADQSVRLHTRQGNLRFDALVCTLPTSVFKSLSSQAPSTSVQGFGAINLVLALKSQLLTDNTYWLNINDLSFPFIAAVEHTNFISPTHYGGDHLVYLGKYLDPSDHRFDWPVTDTFTSYLPFIKRLNPAFDPSWVRQKWLWKTEFAQPITPPGYSKSLPSLITHLPHVYLANMEQVYPWDRGTNYAVELGQKVAALCTKK